jgi:hypothetical protein
LYYYFVQLERANDGFSVVADYFGRGVFNKVEKNMGVASSIYMRKPFG